MSAGRLSCRHALRTVQLVWAMRNSHIGDAFFDLDAAAFLFSEIESNANAASRPSHGSLDLQVRRRTPQQQKWCCCKPGPVLLSPVLLDRIFELLCALPAGGTDTIWVQRRHCYPKP